jgi:hypothetical protein
MLANRKKIAIVSPKICENRKKIAGKSQENRKKIARKSQEKRHCFAENLRKSQKLVIITLTPDSSPFLYISTLFLLSLSVSLFTMFCYSSRF